jgi:hexulose-6-phosphate isomerase
LGVLWFVNIAGEDEREKDLGISIINDCIEIGSRLGARCLLLPIGQPEEVSPAKARDTLYHSIARCTGLAEKQGIVLAVENVVQRVLWDSGDLIELVDRVGSPHCKVYYDVGNPYFAQINPAEEILQLKNRIFQFHVKDMQTVEIAPAEIKAEAQDKLKEEEIKFRGDTTNWKGKKDATIGTGIVNWPAIMNAILDIGFEGYLVTEIQQDATQLDKIAKENIPALKALEQIIQM